MNGVEVSYEGRRYSFEPGKTIRIGRSPDNDVVVSEPTVSRQHAHLGYGPDGWVFQGEGRSGTFLRGATVTRLVVRDAVELTLASPQGPVLRIEPALPGTRDATSVLDMGAALGAPPPPAVAAAGGPVAAQEPAAPPWGPVAEEPAPPGGPGAAQGEPAAPPGQRPGAPGAGSREELASAFQILVPIKSWLTDPGWRQGLRLLVIPYALLPLCLLYTSPSPRD